MVTCLDVRPALFVLSGVRLGVLDHLLDLAVAQAARRLDTDLLLLARGVVLGLHVQDPVGVDVEGDLDLGHTTLCRRDARELELADGLVVERHLPLALEHVDFDRGLVVFGRRENFGFFGRDRGVSLDQRGHHAAERLDAQ